VGSIFSKTIQSHTKADSNRKVKIEYVGFFAPAVIVSLKNKSRGSKWVKRISEGPVFKEEIFNWRATVTSHVNNERVCVGMLTTRMDEQKEQILLWDFADRDVP
jgi:hypothetical protein